MRCSVSLELTSGAVWRALNKLLIEPNLVKTAAPQHWGLVLNMKTCADLTFGRTVNANLPYKLRSFSLTKHCPMCEIKSELSVKSKEKGEIISSLQ